MLYVQCPETYDGFIQSKIDAETDAAAKEKMALTLEYNTHVMFLAGGITGTYNWQNYVVDQLHDAKDSLLIINPRRETFDVSNPAESDFQIEWEHKHLMLSDFVWFWFPHETLCPITLYELGKMAAKEVPLIVGTHPEYKRRYDVIKQLSLIDTYKDMRVYDNLDEMIEVVKGLHTR